MHLNLRRMRALGAALVATLAVAVIPAVADAQPLQNVAIPTEASDGTLVLDVSGGSTANGAPVIQWYGSFAGNQRWNLADDGHGHQTIVNQKSGKCLTTDGFAGHQLYQWTCNGSALQVWSGNFKDSFTFSGLTNPSSGLSMDVNGGSRWAGAAIIAWYPNNGPNQKFTYYQLF